MSGKRIGVITTSTPIDSLKAEQVSRAYTYLEKKGYEIREAEICRKRQDYVSGSIKERVKAIHDFVGDKNIDIIMSFWGGMNTNQILPYLDYAFIKRNPKIFVGYSDTSALLNAITSKTGIITFHGPACITYSKPDLDEYCLEYFEKALYEDEWDIVEPEKYADDLYFLREEDSDRRLFKKNEGLKVYREGVSEGEVVVSNLQTLLVLAGTEYFPSLKGKILFVEEAEEANVQQIDRFFTHLSQLADFNSIKGFVVGKFMEYSNINEKQIKNILKRVSENFNGPVIFNASFGHTDPIFTVPNGGIANIDTSRKNIIKFRYGC